MQQQNYVKNIIILSHEDCNDGLLASHCANSFLENELKKEKIDFTISNFFFNHAKKSLDDVKKNEDLINAIKKAEDFYILDFSFSKEVMAYFYELNPNLNIKVIDHHHTANQEFDDLNQSNEEKYNFLKEQIQKNKFQFEFNNNFSGAVLSYVYFALGQKPSTYQGELDNLIPNFIKYIQDGDIWKWQFADQSKPFCQVFGSKVKTLESCQSFFPLAAIEKSKLQDKSFIKKANFENVTTAMAFKQTEEFVKEGQIIINFYNSQIETVAKEAKEIEVEIDGIKTKGFFINANGLFTSVLGSNLSRVDEDHKFCMVWSETNNEIKVGIRSRDDFDCSVIAKYFGGGGHKQACAFTLNNLEDLVQLKQSLGLDLGLNLNKEFQPLKINTLDTTVSLEPQKLNSKTPKFKP